MPTKTLTDAERQARREADREKAAQAVEALTTSEGWQAWLALRRHFRTYSANNQFLIALQCEDATYVAGFRKWLQLGYAVRRGETAIRIWMPMPPTKKALAEWEAAGAVKEDKPKTRCRLGPVFDRSQVDPLPAPAEPVSLDPPIVRAEGDDLAWCVEPLVELADKARCNVIFEQVSLEWSPAIICLRKAAEHEVVTRVMQPLRHQCAGLDLAQDLADKDLRRLARWCVGRQSQPPELGTVRHVLVTAANSRHRARTSPILRALHDHVRTLPRGGWLLDADGLARALDELTTRFRNPAAHTDALDAPEYAACRELVVAADGLLWRLVDATPT